MSAIVLNFHNHKEAHRRWSNMEKFNELKALGLAPDLGMPSDVNPFDLGETYPVIFWAPEKDPA